VLSLDADLPVYQVMTMDRVIHDAEWVGRSSSGLVTALSLIVMLLSSVGLYAVAAHAVSQQAKEIGIRMAVGARPRQIAGLVLRGASVHVALGLALGVLCTLAWDNVFFSGRAEVSFASPRILVPVAAVLAIVTIAACFIPVRRAATLDPLTTLRQD
jgi:ABC-type antimicrobial peptide transport system permease subunit